MSSSVYLIQAIVTGLYKIGVSKHPNKRLKELKTGNGSDLKLITTYISEYPYKVEKALHNNLSHLKREGEWYKLSLEDELSFIPKCKKFESGIIQLKNDNNVFI